MAEKEKEVRYECVNCGETPAYYCAECEAAFCSEDVLKHNEEWFCLNCAPVLQLIQEYLDGDLPVKENEITLSRVEAEALKVEHGKRGLSDEVFFEFYRQFLPTRALREGAEFVIIED